MATKPHDTRPETSNDVRVAVCIITFQRPDGLRRALSSLGKLRFKQQTPDVEIIVIDNDDQGEAATLAPEFDPSVRFLSEPRRGIPMARNAAVVAAGTDVDFVAFLDDDEAVDPEWLDALLRTQRDYDAGVVTGPVLPVLDEHIPAWMVRGRFFHRRRHATGTQRPHAFTGNVLIRRSLLDGFETCFDERMALTGGEDTHFFKRVRRAGHKIVWANDAIVHEWIPPERATFRWILRRSYRTGCSTAFIELDLNRSTMTLVILLAKAFVWLGMSAVATPLSILLGRARTLGTLRWCAYGYGLLCGLFGRRFEEYR